jgi:hypothetical protein
LIFDTINKNRCWTNYITSICRRCVKIFESLINRILRFANRLKKYHHFIFFVSNVVLQYEECRLCYYNSSFCEFFVVFLLFEERSLSLSVNCVCVSRVVDVNIDSNSIFEFDRFFNTLNALLIWLLIICITLTLRWRDDDDMFVFDFCDNVRFSVTSFTAYLLVFRCIMFFKTESKKNKKMSAMYLFLD